MKGAKRHQDEVSFVSGVSSNRRARYVPALGSRWNMPAMVW